MNDREQRQRERAYGIWESEGRPEGRHEDHWKRAEEQHELTEQGSDDVTKVNQQTDDAFAHEAGSVRSAADIRPPSTSSSD
jgi:hypothetical protein